MSSLNLYPTSPSNEVCQIPNMSTSLNIRAAEPCDAIRSSHEEGVSSGENNQDTETREIVQLEDGTQLSYKEEILSLKSKIEFYQNQCHELRQQLGHLKVQLQQCEEEKQQLELELGRRSFLEDKQKHYEKAFLSSRAHANEQRSHPLTGQTTSKRTTEVSIIPSRERSLDLLPENRSQNSNGDNLLQRQCSSEEGLATAEGYPVTETRETDAQYMPQLCLPADVDSDGYNAVGGYAYNAQLSGHVGPSSNYFTDVGSSGLPAPSIARRSNGADKRHVSEAESSRTSQYALGTRESNVLNTTGDRVVSGANRDVDNAHTEAALLSAGSRGTQLVVSGNEQSNLEPHGAEASLIYANTGGSMLNRDFGAASFEWTDNSRIAFEQRVRETSAFVERVLRQTEEREQFEREIERKEQVIRERKKREEEAREQEEASRWAQQQEAITGRSQWLCEHFQRRCRVRFPCCNKFYPCHLCHNNSEECVLNEKVKACQATHLECSSCKHEQEIGEDSKRCPSCGTQMSAYFCSICKHFRSVKRNPFHCEKCGLCRMDKDKAYHCDMCNVCLNKHCEGNHKCKPKIGQDECCICFEEILRGCIILLCSHKLHETCAQAMIKNNIDTCPLCREPLYSQTSE